MRLNDRELVMRTRQSKAGDDWFRIENHDTSGDTTHVYIYDEIGYWGTEAADFVQQFKDISTSNIHVHINSPGGRVFDGIAIYNAIKQHPSNVITQVDALAASAASFIAQAGNQRVLTRNATMMIHDASAITYGNAQDMRDMAELLDKLSNNVADIYSQAAGGTATDWRALMQEETWYNAQEALDAGLADEILKEEDKNAQQATDKWDMSFFAHASRDSAPSPREVREKLSLVLNLATREAPVTDTATEPSKTEPKTPAAPLVPVPVPAPVPAAVTDTTTITLNGTELSVPTAVAQHVSSLENFRDETIKAGRKNFVASLASGTKPKIVASQIEKLEELALSLSPDQFESWKATWDAAPGHTITNSHAGGISNPTGETSDARAKIEDDLEVAKGTVKQHKLAGMSQEAIEKTPSYQNMQRLEAQLKEFEV